MEPRLGMVVLLSYYKYFLMQDFLYLLSRFRHFYFNGDLVNAGLSFISTWSYFVSFPFPWNTVTLPILYTSLLYAFSRQLNLFLKISPKLPASNHWTVCRMETVWTVLAFQNICNSSETTKIVHRMLMGRNLWSPTSWSKQDYHQVRQGFVWPHF